MKTSLRFACSALATAFLLPASLALAQEGVPFAEVDINADGFLDAAELMALFDLAGLTLLSEDRNGDGLLSRRELRASQPEAERGGVRTADGRAARVSERNLRGRPEDSGSTTLGQADDSGLGPGGEPAGETISGGGDSDRETSPEDVERASPAQRQGNPHDVAGSIGSGDVTERSHGRDVTVSDNVDPAPQAGDGILDDLDSDIGIGDTHRDNGGDPDVVTSALGPGRSGDARDGDGRGNSSRTGPSQNERGAGSRNSRGLEPRL
jgi:hypothetical protein